MTNKRHEESSEYKAHVPDAEAFPLSKITSYYPAKDNIIYICYVQRSERAIEAAEKDWKKQHANKYCLNVY